LTYNDLLARVYNKEHFLSMKVCDSLLHVVAVALINFNEQDRSSVTLSAAKGLARWDVRCFAALSMTFSDLVRKFH
jgi:hypothetical protein